MRFVILEGDTYLNLENVAFFRGHQVTASNGTKVDMTIVEMIGGKNHEIRMSVSEFVEKSGLTDCLDLRNKIEPVVETVTETREEAPKKRKSKNG